MDSCDVLSSVREELLALRDLAELRSNKPLTVTLAAEDNGAGIGTAEAGLTVLEPLNGANRARLFNLGTGNLTDKPLELVIGALAARRHFGHAAKKMLIEVVIHLLLCRENLHLGLEHLIGQGVILRSLAARLHGI